MAVTRKFNGMNRISGVLALSVVLFGSFVSPVHADVVTTYKDDSGWKLQVNGQDYYIKGVVWSYSPRGQNYSYNLWGESDDFIRKVLDYEFTLMKAAGINTIRSFSFMPPEWVTYVYREYGIMTVINPLMGRYGYTIGGKWVSFIDYSDPLTRATLKADTREIVNKYKDVPGVIMFAFGNESNYGLSWSSFEIEDLPKGEQNTAKARYLYSLFNEVIKDAKKIAPEKPFTIVNGDIQYIDLIAELCPDLDLLGSNVYRGVSFTSLWKDVDEKLDLPVLFFEFGSDAFNAREYREDQLSQAEVLKLQWQEMYNKAYGNGEEGNSIGGFVFEWRDEWWKYLQEENLDVQDNNASWSNQAYLFDWAEGQNNMNEEWFGIAALGKQDADGVYTARPRMAYNVLSAIWAMDPYTFKKAAFNEAINAINMDYVELSGEARPNMPFVVYEDGFDAMPWVPSGWMGNAESLTLDGEYTEVKYQGSAAIRLHYTGTRKWAGVAWQHPPNNWGDQDGGFDLTGASALEFWARGENGGEKVSFGVGLLEDREYSDSTVVKTDTIALKSEWKRYNLSLEGEDLSSLKIGFVVTIQGRRSPVTIYLDSVRFIGE